MVILGSAKTLISVGGDTLENIASTKQDAGKEDTENMDPKSGLQVCIQHCLEREVCGCDRPGDGGECSGQEPTEDRVGDTDKSNISILPLDPPP